MLELGFHDVLNSMQCEWIQSYGTLPYIVAFPENSVNKLSDRGFINCFRHLSFVPVLLNNSYSNFLICSEGGGKHLHIYRILRSAQTSSLCVTRDQRRTVKIMRIIHIQHGGGKGFSCALEVLLGFTLIY